MQSSLIEPCLKHDFIIHDVLDHSDAVAVVEVNKGELIGDNKSFAV